jgi:hypothetical protein
VHPEGHVVQKNHKKRVAPLENVVHPEGHVAQKKRMGRVAPLEHVVRPEGHVVLMMMKKRT